MKKFLILLIFLSFNRLYAGYQYDNDKAKKIDSIANSRIKILLADIKFGHDCDDISELKVEAALNLAALLTEKFYLIPTVVKDSIIEKLTINTKLPTIEKVAKELKAERIYFMKVNRLENMLRVDITSVNVKNSKKKYDGIGYSLVTLREEKTEKRIYDAALLKCIQRAMAVAEKDSDLFSKAEGKYKVFPAPNLIIGGIDFQSENKYPQWKLYEKKTFSSIDATLAIFEVAKDVQNYVVWDIPSRDSLFGLFNMHIVENYRPPTSFEIEALTSMEVEMYIMGILRRNDEGAQLDIVLCEISDKKLIIKNTVTGILKNDDSAEFRELIKDLTRKLLKIQT